ncbi:hypothetical protein M378DRAFT_171961 [Amanita muscaria Koide BX008]|uniref:Secreted protein n=1 Tax=Amanita muscaria (strain Koide BX008) TaxID=946122 RepID=A0A0C2S3I6_AMAMK|nr:hypothetical protein M378DRAFT_171961 [Amanita muscaria Koide BX008]
MFPTWSALPILSVQVRMLCFCGERARNRGHPALVVFPLRKKDRKCQVEYRYAVPPSVLELKTLVATSHF